VGAGAPLKSLAPLTCGASTPGPTAMRLLTRAEYDFAVEDLLGDTTKTAASNFAREPLADSFDNDVALNRISADGLKRYMEAAESIAARTVRDRLATVANCPDSSVACGQEAVRKLAKRAYRRPLSAEETQSLLNVFNDGVQNSGFAMGVEWAIASILLSPQFLYREERYASDQASLTRLDNYHLATRLAFFIWSSLPDEALLEAADTGALATDEGVSAQVERMLQDPKAERGKLRFLQLWLGVDNLDVERKDETVFPLWTRSVSKSWEQSFDLYLQHVVRDGNDVRTLLLSPTVYANADLSMYTSQDPTDSFQAFEPENRVGLLTQPGFLAHFASPNQSSPVLRGVFVLKKLLCQSPGPPPAGANLVPPEPSVAKTTRERFDTHSQAGCSSCHERIDAAGFLFENYDGIGLYRTEENGMPVDASGEIVKPHDEKLKGKINGVAELSRKLAESGQVTDCIAQDWMRFMLGRSLDIGDLCSLYSVQREFAAGGGSFDALVRAVAKSDAFKAHASTPVIP
jgi:hypothetical protein